MSGTVTHWPEPDYAALLPDGSPKVTLFTADGSGTLIYNSRDTGTPRRSVIKAGPPKRRWAWRWVKGGGRRER